MGPDITHCLFRLSTVTARSLILCWGLIDCLYLKSFVLTWTKIVWADGWSSIIAGMNWVISKMPGYSILKQYVNPLGNSTKWRVESPTSRNSGSETLPPYMARFEGGSLNSREMRHISSQSRVGLLVHIGRVQTESTPPSQRGKAEGSGRQDSDLHSDEDDVFCHLGCLGWERLDREPLKGLARCFLLRGDVRKGSSHSGMKRFDSRRTLSTSGKYIYI